eukprot:m.108176 g.108176  ORF g.108176 m.108176 type:complete len:224 (+) comp51725_c0_seq2:102-773(+)
MSSPQSLITQVSEEDGVAAFDEEEEQPVGCMARVFPCFRRNRKARATPLPVHRSTAQQVPTEEQKPVDVPGDALLPAQFPGDSGKICLVLDLDETLVHSSFKPVPDADFVVPIEIEGQTHQVYVAKRPHVDKFLKRMGDLFEVVIFTASLAKARIRRDFILATTFLALALPSYRLALPHMSVMVCSLLYRHSMRIPSPISWTFTMSFAIDCFESTAPTTWEIS